MSSSTSRLWLTLLLTWGCSSSAPCESLASYGARLDSDGCCVVPGDLKLNGRHSALPERLRVEGSLQIDGTDITVLPRDLFVGGDLRLHKTMIGRLPEGLVVEGDFTSDGGLGSEYIYCREIPASVQIKGQNTGCLER